MLRAQRVASEAREDAATGRAVDEKEASTLLHDVCVAFGSPSCVPWPLLPRRPFFRVFGLYPGPRLGAPFFFSRLFGRVSNKYLHCRHICVLACTRRVFFLEVGIAIHLTFVLRWLSRRCIPYTAAAGV